MRAAKTKPETPHQAKPAQRSAAKAPKAAPMPQRRDNATERQARIEAAMGAGKGTKLPPGAHSRQAVERFENDKREAQKALGRVSGGDVEQWGKKYKRVLKAPPRPKQGRRTDRDRALAVLAKVGVTDPENDERVQILVDTAYRNGEFLVDHWKAMNADELAMANALEAVQLHTETGKEKRAKLLSQLRTIPPEPAKSGPRGSVGIRAAIGQADACGWTWKEAAACVFLFASDGRSYKQIWTIFKDHEGRRVKKFGA